MMKINTSSKQNNNMVTFVQTFSSVLKAHHMAEDEVIFPYASSGI